MALRKSVLAVAVGCCGVAVLCCGGTTRPTDLPDDEAVGTEPLPTDPTAEPTVPANAPPAAPIGSDEVPDVPPAD